MSSETLSKLMRGSVVAIAVFGLFICAVFLPLLGRDMVQQCPQVSAWFWPWLIFAWLFAAPGFAVLALVWRVSGAVRDETVFTMQTAGWVKSGAILLLGDSAFLIAGNIFFAAFSVNHFSVVFMSFFFAVLGVAFAVLAAVLARYLTKAAVLQEEAEGTL
jgi:hypothetical protein